MTWAAAWPARERASWAFARALRHWIHRLAVPTRLGAPPGKDHYIQRRDGPESVHTRAPTRCANAAASRGVRATGVDVENWNRSMTSGADDEQRRRSIPPHFIRAVPVRGAASTALGAMGDDLSPRGPRMARAGPSVEGDAGGHAVVVGGRDLYRCGVVLGGPDAGHRLDSAEDRGGAFGDLGALAAHVVIRPPSRWSSPSSGRSSRGLCRRSTSAACSPSYVYWLDVNVLTYAMVVVVAWAVQLQTAAPEIARSDPHARGPAGSRATAIPWIAAAAALSVQLSERDLRARARGAGSRRANAQAASHAAAALARACGQDEVTLDEELASLDPYFDIQRARFSEWLTVQLEIDHGARLALVPHLILQPLVENAIRHGLAVRSAAGTVGVRARVTGRDSSRGVGQRCWPRADPHVLPRNTRILPSRCT